MTTDEILLIIQKANRLRSDDFTQDCYLAVLEQGAETEEIALLFHAEKHI